MADSIGLSASATQVAQGYTFAGATGTGKTRTLPGTAEALSTAGVPLFSTFLMWLLAES